MRRARPSVHPKSGFSNKLPKRPPSPTQQANGASPDSLLTIPQSCNFPITTRIPRPNTDFTSLTLRMSSLLLARDSLPSTGTFQGNDQTNIIAPINLEFEISLLMYTVYNVGL